MARNWPGLNSVMSSPSSEYSFSEPDAFSTLSCVAPHASLSSVTDFSSGMSFSVEDLVVFCVSPPFLLLAFAEEALDGSCFTDIPNP